MTEELSDNLSVKINFLWVVDNSGSMSSYQSTLASGANGFVSELSVTGVDYQLGVITTDSTSLVTSSSTDPFTNNGDEFKARIEVGIVGSVKENGLYTSTQALLWLSSHMVKTVVFGIVLTVSRLV
jgi:hypothetical protein